MCTARLSAQPTPFIGRTDELAAIADRLEDPHCRLLTLVGPGGIGKTRLAIEVASRQAHGFPDGVFFVGLQAIATADNIIPTVASTVGFEFYDGHDPTAQLLHYLHERCLLLILDNFEHLLPATDVVLELLNNAPELKLLITSRVALNLQEEWLFHVEGMTYPQDEYANTLDAYSAVKLFVERAQRARHDFSLVDEAPHVVRVCQLVDGLPLGIELAATWLRRMPCPTIAEEIQRGLDILATDLRGIPERHRSMRVVFDHSWALLSEEERRALMGLSVFRGGCSREAAEQVAGATLGILSALVDKSMLRVDNDGRYEIHELQRQYAKEQLDAIPQEKTRFCDQHCVHFMSFLNRPMLDFVSEGNKAILQKIDADIDNVRAAWNWAIQRGRIDDVYNGLRGLNYYYWRRFMYWEAERAFHEVVASLREAQPTLRNQIVLGDALAAQGEIDLWLGQTQQAKDHLQQSVAILRRLDARRELALAVGTLGWAVLNQRDWESAETLLKEAVELAEETKQYDGQAFYFNLLGRTARDVGRHEEAKRWQQQALQLGKQIRDNRTIADALLSLGDIYLTQGEYFRAHQHCHESLAISRAHDFVQFTLGALRTMGQIAAAVGDVVSACSYLKESLAIARHYENKIDIALSLTCLGDVLVDQDELTAAQECYQEALDIMSSSVEAPPRANALAGLGKIAFHSGDFGEAQRLLEASLDAYRDVHDREHLIQILVVLGLIALEQRDLSRSRSYFLESLQEGIKFGALPNLLASLVGIAQLFARQDDLARSVRLAKLVADHAASHTTIRDQAQQLLALSELELPETEYETAIQLAGESELETVALQLVEQLAANIQQPLAESLSERELEVLRCVAAGRTNREIARDLTLALGTVKSHLHHILQKLDADNRTEAVARARDLRLL